MRAAATLSAVNRRDATTSWARSSLLALALALLVPGLALAQDASEEQPEVEGGEAEGGDPDALAQDGGGYEPDQRGEHEEESESEAPSVVVDAAATRQALETTAGVGASESYRSDFGFELALWLGGVVTDLDIVGGGNLVRATQRGSVGASFGFAAGMRFGPVIVGPRVGLTVDPSFLLADLGVGVEVLLMPEAMTDGITSYVRAAVGGSLVTDLSAPLPEQRDAGIAGTVAEVGIGARWTPWRGLVIGLELAGIWHHLWREPVEGCDIGCNDGSVDLLRAGESDALQLRLSLSAGWTF